MFLKGREEKWKRGGNVQKTKTIHKSNITTRMCLYENHNKTSEKQLSAFYVFFPHPISFQTDPSRAVLCFVLPSPIHPKSSCVFFPGARVILSHPIHFWSSALFCSSSSLSHPKTARVILSYEF